MQVEHVISEKTILDQCKHPFIVHLACTFHGEFNYFGKLVDLIIIHR